MSVVLALPSRPLGSLASWAPDCDRVDWRDRAACRGLGNDEALRTFFPADQDYREARGFCADCTVLDDCRTDVLATGDAHGFRAGMTPTDRRASSWPRRKAS